MKRRLKTGRKALRLAIFAVESTHEQTNFYRTAIAVGGEARRFRSAAEAFVRRTIEIIEVRYRKNARKFRNQLQTWITLNRVHLV